MSSNDVASVGPASIVLFGFVCMVEVVVVVVLVLACASLFVLVLALVLMAELMLTLLSSACDDARCGCVWTCGV